MRGRRTLVGTLLRPSTGVECGSDRPGYKVFSGQGPTERAARRVGQVDLTTSDTGQDQAVPDREKEGPSLESPTGYPSSPPSSVGPVFLRRRPVRVRSPPSSAFDPRLSYRLRPFVGCPPSLSRTGPPVTSTPPWSHLPVPPVYSPRVCVCLRLSRCDVSDLCDGRVLTRASPRSTGGTVSSRPRDESSTSLPLPDPLGETGVRTGRGTEYRSDYGRVGSDPPPARTYTGVPVPIPSQSRGPVGGVSVSRKRVQGSDGGVGDSRVSGPGGRTDGRRDGTDGCEERSLVQAGSVGPGRRVPHPRSEP